MKNWTKQLLVAVVAISALTACSDSNLSDVESGVPAPPPQGTNSAVLTDASGNQVSCLSSKFATYYLDIKTNGAWYIESSDNMEFTPTKMLGKGNTRVPVLVGNNWAEARQLSYKVNFINETSSMRRAGEANEASQTVTQESATDLTKFKEIVNSNIFVGYGYNATKNSVPELCTGIEIFKMDSLNTTALVTSSLSPQAKEMYYYHHSDSVLDKIIAVNANPGGNFGVVKLGIGVGVNITDQTDFRETVMQKSLTRSIYGREIDFAEAQIDQRNFTKGFMYYKDRFVTQFKAAGDNADKKKKASEEFFNVVGTHFIAKALLGCELNYRINVDSSKTNKATSVKAALDFKWQQQVKDTAGVDSVTKAKILELMKDSTKLKNFVFKGNVQVTDSVFNAATSTTAKVKARGGDVERVNILTTGGSLLCEDLAAWLLGTEPEKAVMVGIITQPIYFLFDIKDPDELAVYEYLKDYIDTNYKINDPSFGVLKDE
jgi:hypothetical protein